MVFVAFFVDDKALFWEMWHFRSSNGDFLINIHVTLTQKDGAPVIVKNAIFFSGARTNQLRSLKIWQPIWQPASPDWWKNSPKSLTQPRLPIQPAELTKLAHSQRRKTVNKKKSIQKITHFFAESSWKQTINGLKIQLTSPVKMSPSIETIMSTKLWYFWPYLHDDND